MIARKTKLRWRRVFRRRQRQVEDISLQAEETLDRHFIKRLYRLIDVRRFVAGWVLLLAFLSGALLWQFRTLNDTFQSLQPVPGGTYSEGMVGPFTNANPLYAASITDNTLSRLLFASLLTYDSKNQLVGDLAESWKVDKKNTTYTVALKPNLTWHDGQPLTADDVVYTFQTAQNPDAQSPLFRSWNGIHITALDNQTVQFVLPAPFAPFLYNLTTGIIPKHILANTNMSELRSSQFNTTKPVGAGPFTWGSVELINNGTQHGAQRIGLKPFSNYHLGKPKLDGFVVKTYTDKAQLLDDFKHKSVNALVGFEEVPNEISHDPDLETYTATLTAETMAFFKTTSDTLKDVTLRQALARSIDVPHILSSLGYPVAVADGPLLHDQLAYNPSIKQPGYNLKIANKLFDKAGWKQKSGGDNMRYHKKVPLTLHLVAQATTSSTKVSTELQKAWRKVGVDVKVSLMNENELQNTIRTRDYDILLYGISLGVDPDVFAYWHSTQADMRSGSRLNFSDYKSSKADSALEAGRSRSDPMLRAAKYKPFLEAWHADVPALALYQPRSLYITNTPIFGVNRNIINTAADRLNNVQDLMIRQEQRPNS